MTADARVKSSGEGAPEGIPWMLVIAGHDSSGGAGVDADREAADRFGVRASCVITARTDQDEQGVRSLGARAPADCAAEVLASVRAEREPPGAVKVGLLPGAEHVRALGELLGGLQGEPGWIPVERGGVPVVLDPVIAASTGRVFLDETGVRAMVDDLAPLGLIWTPNLPEMAALRGCEPEELLEPEARVEAARFLTRRGAAAVLLKGGHGEEDPVRDLILEGEGLEPRWHEHPRRVGRSLHGSGCRYASAVAAGLARGDRLAAAARGAGRWLAALLEAGA